MAALLTDVQLLDKLVSFDSTSSKSNLPIADFICDYLDASNVEIVRNENDDHTKVNLVIRIGGKPAGDPPSGGLVLSGRTDVVPANEPQWKSDPFRLTETEDAYIGRGVCDMKGFDALAINLARRALDCEDVPIGALVVREGQVIARGYNQREKLQDPTAHAEMIALTAAAEYVGHWRLEGCTVYVTLEPCPMCAGALVQARVQRLVYGAADGKAGACGSLFRITEDARLNHQVETVGGVLGDACTELLREFFRHRRALGEK